LIWAHICITVVKRAILCFGVSTMVSLSEGTRNLLFKVLFVATLLAGFCFFVAGAVSANLCYVSPCQADDDNGVVTMYKTNTGLGFQAVFSGLAFIVYPIWGLVVMRKGGPSQEQMGLLLGLAAVLCAIALESGALWGSQTLFIDELMDVQGRRVRSSSVNGNARPAFAAAAGFGGLLFVLYLPLLALLWWSRYDDFGSTAATERLYGAAAESSGSSEANYQGAEVSAHISDSNL